MNASTKINGNIKSKAEMTDLLYALFKSYVECNPRCFSGMSIKDIIDYLCDAVDIVTICIDSGKLKNMIINWFYDNLNDSYDVDIYY